MQKYAAHISESKDIHRLENHLTKVARKAAKHAAHFQSGQWAELAGRWHDLGKYSATFQKMIYEANGMEAHVEPEGVRRRDHSTAGALYAVKRLGVHGHILAYLIAGHHAGLPDWYKLDVAGGALSERLKDSSLLADALKAAVPAEILAGDMPTQAPLGGSAGFALWVRMLFSALVDADFLDTESFYNPKQSRQRSRYIPIAELKMCFDQHMQCMLKKAEVTTVNKLRASILSDCRQAGQKCSGVFSLTVPTGGGKTLSSMAFALEHAIKHQKSRIIYAIPYTSIIEQTVDTFRKIFSNNIIEHHSSLDPDKEDHQSRLASENWDAPIVVTTNVQFFESLFAARTSRCRKLHNIANSIVILDEAQLLPPAFLQPILNVINLLSQYYNVTFVLSTATQPALNKDILDPFGRIKLKGLQNVREIISDPDHLYRQLERVHITLPQDFQQPNHWNDMADDIMEHDSVLVIVNSRKDVRELCRLIPDSIHLSALMCGEHRSQVIAQIKENLKANMPIRVVSTQLVEAGVDLDFPVVYRALAGLDSIAQAAGRCNREGTLPEKGKVVVFVPPPAGHLLRAAQKTISLLAENQSDPLTRARFTQFFEAFYHDSCLDKANIEELLNPEDDLSNMQFRTAAMKMKLIDDTGQIIFVRYNDTSEELLNLLERIGPNRELMRKLQRYTVTVPEYAFKKLQECGDVQEIASNFYVQTCRELYHPDLGLLLEGENMATEDTIW